MLNDFHEIDFLDVGPKAYEPVQPLPGGLAGLLSAGLSPDFHFRRRRRLTDDRAISARKEKERRQGHRA